MALDFSKLLSTNMDQVEKPKPLPAGTYLGHIAKYEFGEVNNEKKTPYCRVFLTLSAPGPDVEQSALDEAKIDLSKRQMRRDYYLSDDAIYRLKEMLASVGVDTRGRSFGEAIPDILNAPVIIEVSQRNGGDDGTTIFNDVKNVKGQ